MVKKIGIFITALVCLLVLAGCGCEHVWQDATCQAPATCELCGKTEGELGNHIWNDATCTQPKTCATCGAMEGFKLDHSFLEPTCEEPATCERCGQTEGEALGHDWLTLTCIIVCERCKAEDPSAPGHVLHEATCNSPSWCEVCNMEFGEPTEHAWLDADCSNPKRCANCKLREGTHLGHTLADGNDGVSGICTTCNKAVECYYSGDNVRTLYAWTDYEIAADGSYTNPVTYLLKSWKNQTYESFTWFDSGNLQDYDFKTSSCMAFYAQGKVYYFKSYSSDNPKAVARALANAASKHVSWTNAVYSDVSYTDVILAGADVWTDHRGYSYAAQDIYGNTYAIVNKLDGWTENPAQTWAVACDWMK